MDFLHRKRYLEIYFLRAGKWPALPKSNGLCLLTFQKSFASHASEQCRSGAIYNVLYQCNVQILRSRLIFGTLVTVIFLKRREKWNDKNAPS